MSKQKTNINDSIRSLEVRVISDDLGNLGVMKTRDAIAKAKELGLDLIEISPDAVPPVAKIMDYGKFQYSQNKKQKEIKVKTKAASASGEVKNIQIKVGTGDGDELNRNIMQYAREKFNLLLGEKQAEEIKIKIGSAIELSEPMLFPMRGRDLVSGLPKEVMIDDAQVREAISKSLRAIIENIKGVLEITPPELVADIHERGIVLSGGGALLRGFDQLITRAIEIPVRIADDPLTSVVRGTGILLDEAELLNEISIKNQNKKIV
jgi:translation initiation factor IF-3